MTAGRVTSVVFDIGGVLLDWDPRYLYRQLIDDPGELDWFLTNVCTSEWNATLDAGRPFDEACEELAAEHPDHAELVHAWKRQEEMIAGEVPGTADLVSALRAKGVPLFLLTNMPADIFDERLERHPVMQGFDGAVVSGRDGVIKPTPEAFELLTKRFELQPSETLFIDDSEPNVKAAIDAGLWAHHFRGAGALRAALEELDLL